MLTANLDCNPAGAPSSPPAPPEPAQVHVCTRVRLACAGLVVQLMLKSSWIRIHTSGFSSPAMSSYQFILIYSIMFSLLCSAR